MLYRAFVRPLAAVLGTTLIATSAFAQAEPKAPAPVVGPKVMSDAAPLPAEDRDSHGAIVLEQSPVRAQRGNPAATMGNVAAPTDKVIKEEERKKRKAEKQK